MPEADINQILKDAVQKQQMKGAPLSRQVVAAPDPSPDGLSQAIGTAARSVSAPQQVTAFAGEPNPEFLDALAMALPAIEMTPRTPEKEDPVFGKFFEVIDFIAQPFYSIRNMQVNAVRAMQGKESVSWYEAAGSAFAWDSKDRVRSTFADVLEEAGVPEGLSVDMPVIGKVTSRDALGLIIDIIDPTDPLNKLRLFSKTAKGVKAQAGWMQEMAGRFAERLPGKLSKTERKVQATEFIQKFLGNRDKKALLRTMSQEAKEGHRAIVQFWGFDPLPTAFNVKVFEAFGKAAKGLSHVPVIGNIFKNRPIKRVLKQFIVDAESSRNMRFAKNVERARGLEEMMRQLPHERQAAIAPALERMLSYRRIMAQGMEEGLTTQQITQRMNEAYPGFAATISQEGRSLEGILDATRLEMRDRIGQMTVGELPGMTKAKLPDGVFMETSLDEYWAVRTGRQNAEGRIDDLSAALTERIVKPRKRITDRAIRTQVVDKSREFNKLARAYANVLDAESKDGVKAWLRHLEASNTAVEKAQALPLLKRQINDWVGTQHSISVEDLKNFPGKELTINGRSFVSEFDDQLRMSMLRDETGTLHLADDFADADGVIRQDVTGFLNHEADDAFVGTLQKHLDEVSGLSSRAGALKDDRRFTAIDNAIEKAAIKGGIEAKTRMAVEIAQKRQARETMMERANELIEPKAYNATDPDDYFVNQRYFDSISVHTDADSLKVGENGAYILQGPDGSTVRGVRLENADESDKMLTGIENWLKEIRNEEMAADVLDDFLEGYYFPRYVKPEMLEALHTITQGFGVKARKAYSTWFQGTSHRSITTMTMDEFNLLNRTKKTRFSQIYSAKERGKITKMFSKMDPEVAPFFDVDNPVLNVLRRANTSARVVSNKQFVDGALDFFSREAGASFTAKTATQRNVTEELARRLELGEDVAIYVKRGELNKALGVEGPSKVEKSRLAERGEHVVPSAMEEVGEGQLDSLWRSGKDSSVYVLPKEVIGELERVNSVFNSPEALGTLLNSYRYVLGLFKGYALMGPSYHARNGGSALIMNQAAGVSPRAYERAANFYLRRVKGKPMAGTFATDIPGVEFTNQRVLEMMEEMGVKNSGVFGAELAEALQQQLRPGSVVPWKTNFYGLRLNRYVGQGVEDYMRTAHFVDVLKKTGNAFEAQRSVNKYLYNYAKDLPQWEKSMSLIVPFWRWTRNNIPMTTQMLFTHPGTMRNVAIAKEYIESNNEEMFPRRFLPDFIKDGLGMQMRMKNGQAEFFLIKNWVPLAEVDEVFKWVTGTEDTNQFQEMVKSAVDRIGPLKTPIELFASEKGYSTFFRREIERFPGETAPFLTGRPGKKWLEVLRMIRPLNDLDKLNPFNVLGEDRPGKVELSEDVRWWNYMTGGRVFKADSKKAYDEFIRVQRRAATDLKLSLRYILKRPLQERQQRKEEIEKLKFLIQERHMNIKRARAPR